MTREAAFKEMATPPLVEKERIDYVIKKLGLTQGEFEAILNAPNRSFRDYHTSYDALKRLAPLIKLATHVGAISPVVYEKFVKS